MALILLAIAAPSPPAAPRAKLVYGPQLPAPPRPRATTAPCPPPDQRRPDELIVCGRRDSDAYRLPLRDERIAAGEVVRHAGEPARPDGGGAMCDRPGCAEPSQARRTWRRILSAPAGEDPD